MLIVVYVLLCISNKNRALFFWIPDAVFLTGIMQLLLASFLIRRVDFHTHEREGEMEEKERKREKNNQSEGRKEGRAFLLSDYG